MNRGRGASSDRRHPLRTRQSTLFFREATVTDSASRYLLRLVSRSIVMSDDVSAPGSAVRATLGSPETAWPRRSTAFSPWAA